MNADAFLDTNVLIYATLADDPSAAIALDLVRNGGVISVQVLNEFANTARRKLRRSWPDIGAVPADLRTLCPTVRPITVDTHAAALALAERDGLGVHDATIVAAALEAGCITLRSEDMQDNRVLQERLRIRNPFASRPRA